MSKRRHHSAGSRPIRPLKVGEAMRHALAGLLMRDMVHDADLDGHIVSVSEVEVTADLRQAIAWISVVGADVATQQQVCDALNRHRRLLQSRVAEEVNTRYAAELEFRLDPSFDEGSRIDALLRSPEVTRDLTGDPDGDN